MIKFRIWDTKFNRYRYDTEPLQEEDDSGEKIGWYETCGEDADIFLHLLKDIQEDDRWVLQQWTGLKDKNGLDIYEGDVIILDGYKILTVVKEDKPIRFIGESFYKLDTMAEPEIVKIAISEDSTKYEKIGTIFGLDEMPCIPDHNGECLICDCWLSECHLHEHLKLEK